MEWSKTNLTSAELEKKQKEFMEQAVKMAKRAVKTPVEQPVAESPVYETAEEIIEEIVDAAENITEPPETSEKEIAEEIAEAVEEINEVEKSDNDFFDIAEVAEDEVDVTFGVFDRDELTKAIESGEISGEGLKQAAEILAEMTNKTEMMKKLVEEQENAEENTDNGGDFGLNGYIDRHNNNCRGCKNGNFNAP